MLHVPLISQDCIVRIKGHTWELELGIGKNYPKSHKTTEFLSHLKNCAQLVNTIYVKLKFDKHNFYILCLKENNCA